ncbi:unnamed protein product [Linum tenue]|uniref:Cucumisin n=1 Tax=Linum tenue TaxID=586396 RepID=A0AAV0JZA2_9ROSI|nr:unnamed protein product [Linum tenue]
MLFQFITQVCEAPPPIYKNQTVIELSNRTKKSPEIFTSATMTIIIFRRWVSVLYPILLASILLHYCRGNSDERKVHIVYMGERPHSPSGNMSSLLAVRHISLLERVLGRCPNFGIGNAEMKRVISVIPNHKLHLHTTRSWEFMNFSPGQISAQTEGNVIIGFLDSGIWPESESFNDEGMTPPPAKWKGECHNITCNNKIIGARYYNTGGMYDPSEFKSPRDAMGHGTHTSSTAAGRKVAGASFLGLAEGTATGGVPNARIAVYKVCWQNRGCSNADILAAFDDAIADGVDILSMSLGSSVPPPFFEDAMAIGAFHAMKRGVLTSASSGNSGPTPATASNLAPWMLTVAASTIDRQFVSKVVLGNGETFPGIAVNSFKLNGTTFPLVWAGDVANYSGGSGVINAKNCLPGSLNSYKTAGKIVLCHSIVGDLTGVAMANGLGAILFNPVPSVNDFAFSYPLPATQVRTGDGDAILDYIRTTENPIATILVSETWKDVMAPYVASFSSRGPNRLSPEILKPDITVPGVDILAAWSPVASPSGSPFDTRKVKYNVISGTSMSCPHASAVAAYVKALHPDWSPAAIKSAIMTTANVMDPRKNEGHEFAHGSGHINPVAAADPGLVYDASEDDYIYFLCKQGYDNTTMELIAGRSNASCNGVAPGRAWDLNYPTFGLVVEDGESISTSFTRTVTNVGPPNSTYHVSVQMPSLVNVEVHPTVLPFSAVGQSMTFTVKVSGPKIVDQPIRSGAILWGDGVHVARSPLVVYTITPNSMAALPFKPAEKIRFGDQPGRLEHEILETN